MLSDASPENTPERHLPGVAASDEGPGQSWPNWINGQVTLTGIPAQLPRHSVGRAVVRENDSCSPLRRITSATPPPRAAAISSSLVDALLPIRKARWNDDHQSRSACNNSPRRLAAASKPTGRSLPRQTRMVRMTLTAKGTSPPTADTAQGQPGFAFVAPVGRVSFTAGNVEQCLARWYARKSAPRCDHHRRWTGPILIEPA